MVDLEMGFGDGLAGILCLALLLFLYFLFCDLSFALVQFRALESHFHVS